MVNVIAAALEAHRGDFSQDDWWIICKCGQQWPVGGRVRSHEANNAFDAHQAHAVLAAISEAGAVEWGVRQIHDHRNVWETNYASKADAEAAIQQEITPQIWEPAHRIAAGPWTAVEAT